MSRGVPIWHIFTKLPKRSMLVMTTAVVGIATNYVGRRVIRDMETVNLETNMEKLNQRKPDWSCFYYAKQYREECSDYNRAHGGEYIAEICSKLEASINECSHNLAKEIADCHPYAMDSPIRVASRPPWLNSTVEGNSA